MTSTTESGLVEALREVRADLRGAVVLTRGQMAELLQMAIARCDAALEPYVPPDPDAAPRTPVVLVDPQALADAYDPVSQASDARSINTMVELQERTAYASEAIVVATAPADGACEWCENGKLQVLRKLGEMPIAMICGYCRGTGKADG